MKSISAALTLWVLTLSTTWASEPNRIPLPAAIPAEVSAKARASDLRQYALPPLRIVWKSAQGVTHAESLLAAKPGQPVLSEPNPPTELASTPGVSAGVLVDFGVEIQGYLELLTPMMPEQTKMRRVRVRFGESASEAMSELGGKQNAGNDHAIRDQIVTVPWLGKIRLGPSGFRFARIDNVNPDLPVQLSQVQAVLEMRDLPYVGSFRCDDARLNRIWQVGAYTVQLNMQEYLWDGIKRDRLVWLGDLHPEVSTINAVFGFHEVVPKSLDLIRDVTKPTEWMNGISSYSMWWIIIQEDWWLHHGDRPYLEAQKAYLTALIRHLVTFIGPDGRESLNGMRFLDWPTYENPAAVAEGLQAMMVLALESGARLMDALGDTETRRVCEDGVARLRRHQPATSGRKSPAALLALAGVRDPVQVAESILRKGGPKDLSTFYGFYVLESLARAGDINTALDFISQFWGGMLDVGATTFWEDFDLEWTKLGSRIDELVPEGTRDIHGDCGAHCYVGFRHSLCHGWASGPTSWLSRHVLGIRPVGPGCRQVRITPNLGRLKWAEGAYPTPKGAIRVRHERSADGSVQSQITAPPGVEVLR
ncbi:MAG: hypothetical protein JNK85_21905 [Verrucomicrobiales bacterium]|nr:hypothetical protein [Verrucomicrobiales bacterium]